MVVEDHTPSMRQARRVILGIVVVGLLAPGLVYPYFEDTALFAAVAKLALGGARLYRDVVEQKTPGVLFMEMGRLTLLGGSSLAARAAELSALALAAFVITDLARAARLPARAGALMALALAALSSSAIWGLPERGQVEFHQVPWIVVALVAAARAGEPRPRALAWAAGAGAAIAWAMWLKPQAGLLGLALLVALALAPGPRWRRVGAFVAGGAAVSLAVLARLALAGELDAFLDVMLRFNPAYLRISRIPWPRRIASGLGLLLQSPRVWAVDALALAGAVVVVVRARRRALPVHMAVLLLAPLPWGMFSYVAGGYGFIYHSIAAVVGLALLVGVGGDALLARVPRSGLRVGLAGAVLAALTLNAAWLRDAGDLLAWVSGRVREDELYARRGIESGYYSYSAEREAAKVVDELVPAGERFFVFGRAGATYLLAHRAPAARHLVTSVAWIPDFAFARQVHDELVATLTARPPALLLLSTADVFPWFGQNRPSAALVLEDAQLGPWLESHYDLVGRIGPYYAVARRKSGNAR
jgi:Dolichyl-phosphate-mannose-protein mannosyltransferase